MRDMITAGMKLQTGTHLQYTVLSRPPASDATDRRQLPVTAAQFEFAGLPGFLAYPVFAAEIVGGVTLIFGFLERQVSLLLVPLLLTATWVYLPNSWLHTRLGGGWEYPLFLTALSIILWVRILQQYLPPIEMSPTGSPAPNQPFH